MERTYFVRRSGSVDLDAPHLDTFAAAMRYALTLPVDEPVTIERTTDRPGLRMMQARYLPTGPGRGWDFGMMSSDER